MNSIVRCLLLPTLVLAMGCPDVTVNEAPEVEGDTVGECDDGVDNDQDGSTDCADSSCADADTCNEDRDDDGWSEDDGDCDDTDPAVNPGAVEVTCNGVDEDCDPATPDDVDVDDDTSPCSVDCDDADPTNFPGNPEVCDGADNDCNDLADFPGGEADGDMDQVLECDDCDDGDDGAGDRALDADCDGELDGDDCDDDDPLAFDDNGGSSDCAGRWCLDIRDRGHAAGDGTYWIDPTSTAPFEAWCDMTTDGGGWTQIVDHDFATDACPGGWLLDALQGVCGRQGTATQVLTATFDTSSIPYTEVLGSLSGYQWGTNNAFEASNGIDGTYVDGLSLTFERTGRQHLFTYAVGLSTDPPAANLGGACPADGGANPPSWVGASYACATTNTGSSFPTVWSASEVFSDVGFQASVGASTTSAIEGRLMANEPGSSEDLGISELELLVR